MCTVVLLTYKVSPSSSWSKFIDVILLSLLLIVGISNAPHFYLLFNEKISFLKKTALMLFLG
jgi:hypothetical protein